MKMENRGDPGNRQQQNDNEKQKDTSFIIRIPSYEEVVESSGPKTTQHSLFNPSPSFSQAFNFIKNSEFYTTPPLSSPSQPSKVSPSPSPSHAPPPRFWCSLSIYLYMYACACEYMGSFDRTFFYVWIEVILMAIIYIVVDKLFSLKFHLHQFLQLVGVGIPSLSAIDR